MSLTELIAQIHALDNDDFTRKMFGMVYTEYKALLAEFSQQKKGDKTRKFKDEGKLVILILKTRFELREIDIKNLFFPRRTKALATFLDSGPKRLENALAKTKQRLSVLTRPRYLYSPYTTLSELQKVAEISLEKHGLINTRIRASADQQALTGFLTRPLRLKSKRGQDNFDQLIHHFMRDMMSTDISEHDSALVLTTIMHLFMHNSSHSPRSGFGKTQNREAAQQQYYFRSQGDHPHSDFLKQAEGHSTNDQCILRRNSALQTILCAETIADQSKNGFFKRLQKYNEQGYPLATATKKDKNFFPTLFAHSGLRTNNFTQYYVNLFNLFNAGQESAIRQLFALGYIAKTKKRIPLCNNSFISERIKHVQQLFALLPLVDNREPKVFSALHQERNQQALNFVASFDPLELDEIQLSANAYSNCIFITFYPNKKTPDNDNYAEGVTNVLIGFLSGLINHHLTAAGLETHTQRRQSFGMLRTTTTDLGKLKARLSLGVETPAFINCLKNALEVFDTLLKNFDFTKPNCDVLKAGFKAAEKPRHEKPTINDGNFFRKAMRSPFKQANAVNAAEHFLKLHPTHSLAFEAYLQAIIDDQLTQTYTPTIPTTIETTLATRNTPLLNLLANARLETIRRVNKLAETIEAQPFKFTYYHVLVKLFGYCEKANALLLSANTLPASHVYALALHLFEHLSEYLIQLDALKLNLLNAHIQPIEKLQNREQRAICSQLQIESEQCHVYFTDSGQSANVSALYMLCMQMYPTEEKVSLNDKIFIDHSCYYELQDFLRQELGLKITTNLESANIVFTDITSINEESAEKFNCANVNAIVLDITNQPLLDEPTANEFITTLLENDIWVVLTSSMLKHEQAGLDKYQAGKLIILTPEASELNEDVDDSLTGIMQHGFNPMVARFLRTLNKVGGQHLDEPQAPGMGI